MRAYIYTLADCEACVTARAMCWAQGLQPVEVPINNPLVELGVKLLFRDGQVHAPVIWIPNKGAYILSQDTTPQMLRVLNLEPARQEQ